MDPTTQQTLRAAEEAVNSLIELCVKGGPLYAQNRRAVAHVSRTGKWLLNAVAALRGQLDAASNSKAS